MKLKKQKINRVLVFLVLILIFLYYVVSVKTLTNFPIVNVDEGWQWNNALLFVNPKFHSINLHFWSHGGGAPYVLDFLLGVVAKFWGVGVFQGRALILGISIVVLIILFSLAKRLYDFRTALLIVVFLISTDTFLSGSRVIRTDLILGAYLLVWAHLFLSFVQTRKTFWLILASLVLSFGFEVHQNSALFYLGTLATLAIFPTKTLQKKLTLLAIYLTGSVVYSIFYLFAHVLPNTESFMALNKYGIFIDHPLPIFSMFPVELVMAEIGRYSNYFGGARIIEFGIICFGFVLCLLNKKFKESFLALFIFFSALAFLLFSASKLGHYFATFYVIYAIFAGKILSMVLFFPFEKLSNFSDKIKTDTFTLSLKLVSKKQFRKTLSISVICFFVLFLLFNGFRIAIRLKNFSSYNLNFLGSQINQVIPSGSKVMGLPYWMPVLPNQNFISFYTLTWYRILEGEPLNVAFSEISPNFLILDQNVSSYLVDSPRLVRGNFFQQGLYNIYRPEFLSILDHYGKPIATLSDQFLGPIKVYQLNIK